MRNLLFVFITGFFTASCQWFGTVPVGPENDTDEDVIKDEDVIDDSEGDINLGDEGDPDSNDQPDQSQSCIYDHECDDEDPCNGQEWCDAGQCREGNPMEDGSPCTDPLGNEGTCESGICVALTCGDGIEDEGEECDDGNEAPEDGCESNCTYTCHDDNECEDLNPCTLDSCDFGGNGKICRFELTLGECDDGDPCTYEDTCNDAGFCEGIEYECIPGQCEFSSSCDGYGECISTPATEGTECDDMNPCTTNDHCDRSGACRGIERECDDNNACTEDYCDTTTGYCIYDPLPLWYRDEDGDGYGDPSRDVCASTAPPGYVDNGDDCCDSDEFVFPDQESFFGDYNLCSGMGTISFDYNCDHVEERRWNNIGGCDYACHVTEGWLSSSVPNCGQDGTYVTDCRVGSDSCTAITEPRTQECR